MNISVIKPHSLPEDLASLQGKIACYQKVFREWSDYLTPNEQVVLLQIIDRTIGWGRGEAYFTTRAMLKGDKIYSGLNMHRATLFRALASLEDRGFIRRRPDSRVLDRVHYSADLKWTPEVAVNLPKRPRAGSQTQSHSETTPSHSATLITVSPSVLPNGSLAGATAPLLLEPTDRVREIERVAAATNRARLTAKTTAQGAVESVEATWRLALIETFPGTACRSWGVREKAQVKTAAKNWRGDITFQQFVDWSVRNWTAIMSKQFKWMTRETPPAVPVLGFLIAFITQFADCRAEHKLEEWMSAADRTTLERAMGRGQTYEQAVADIAETKVAFRLRDELNIREIKVRSRERGVDDKLKRAQDLAEMEGRAPVHPRSRAAERMRQEATDVILTDDEDFTGAGVSMVDPDRNPFD